MKTQDIKQSSDFQGRVFVKDNFWGHSAKQVQKAAKQLREMRIVKDAECDIIIDKCSYDKVYVSAQRISDYCKKPNKYAYRTVNRVSINNELIVSSAKRIIPEYNQKVLPLIKQPKNYTSETYYNNGAICVRAVPKPQKSKKIIPFLGTTRLMINDYTENTRKILTAIKDVTEKIEPTKIDLFITKNKHIKKEGYLEVFIQKAEDYVSGEKPNSIFLVKQKDVKSIAAAAKEAYKDYCKQQKAQKKSDDFITKLRNAYNQIKERFIENQKGE